MWISRNQETPPPYLWAYCRSSETRKYYRALVGKRKCSQTLFSDRLWSRIVSASYSALVASNTKNNCIILINDPWSAPGSLYQPGSKVSFDNGELINCQELNLNYWPHIIQVTLWHSYRFWLVKRFLRAALRSRIRNQVRAIFVNHSEPALP